MMQKMRLVTTLIGICVIGSLVGCMDIRSVRGVTGPWPELPEPTPLALTDTEYAHILKWAKEDPGLIEKIKRKSDEMTAVIVAYNKLAKQHNHDALIAIANEGGWKPEEVAKYIGPEKSK